MCPTCLRTTGKIADDHTLLELIQEISPTKSSENRDPTADFIPGSAQVLHFDLKPFRDPRFATFTAWEQAQIVELDRRGYRVQSKLGDGGFGVVFLAVDSAERLVAVKMLHAALTEDRYRQRFAIEANALSLLDDPALVKLYHYDVSGPDPMLVTEYVPGGTLAKQLHGHGVFELAEAAEVIRQLAEVVHKVHNAGLVHRDIKPSNILIGGDGRYKLGDFGLAKRLDRDDDLTPTGRGIGGTPEYSAPEQFRTSGDCDGRADIYALGTTLYRLLTGKPVFERKGDGDFVAVILRVLSEEPVPPRKLRPDIPRALEAVCLKCLAKNPTERYRTAADLAADLKAWQTGQQMQVRPSTLVERTWSRVRRVPKFPVAMVLVALLGLGAAFLMMNKDDGSKTEPDVLVVMQKELENGNEVILVPETGRPRRHRWVVGSPEIGKGLAGGTGFEALDASVLELYPDTPEHFLLRGKLRFATTRFHNDAGEHPYIGFFVGGQKTVAPGNPAVTAYSLTGLQFQDGPMAVPVRAIRFQLVHFIHRDGELQPKRHTTLGSLGFTPSEGFPGPWREFSIEVTADSVKAGWIRDGALQLLTPTNKRAIDAREMEVQLAAQQRRLDVDPAVVGLELPPWNPRGAVGVWGFKAAVEFGEISLQKLP